MYSFSLLSMIRLLLLLQSFDSFVEQVRCNQGGQQKQQRGPLSVGLVVRSYWSHLVQFTNLTVCKQLFLSEDKLIHIPTYMEVVL